MKTFIHLIIMSVVWALTNPVAFTQNNTLSGLVVDEGQNILVGASLYWKGTQTGAITNEDGYFSLDKHPSIAQLVVSYVGYQADTILIEDSDSEILIMLALGSDLEEVQITETQLDHFASTVQTINTEVIGSGELRKAACCNLSESFTTNGTVSVSYSDAVTGAKEIQMLGLRGIYSQMLLENRPAMRGLGYTFGMEYIPGTWVSNISIAKGATNITTGYEGITGNLNIELIKPFEAEPVFVNGYVNHVGRSELNVHLNKNINTKWSTGLLLHGNYFDGSVDHNEDTFLEMPQKQQLNGLFRAFYRDKYWRGQFNVQALSSLHRGGQLDFVEGVTNDLYGFELNTNRVEVFGKMGYLGFANPFKSVGFIMNATYHQNEGFMGRKPYEGVQRSVYTSLVLQNILRTTDHNYKLGINYFLDDYDEAFDGIDFDRTEMVTGLFAEYSYVRPEGPNDERRWGVVAGLRADYHNLFGAFIVPRVSFKYNFDDHSVVRISAGRGVRTARVVAENFGMLNSARTLNRTEALQPEDAWNIGFNVVKNVKLFQQTLSLSLDAYSTRFVNQVVVDRETVSDEILLYNLDGQAYANNLMLMAIYTPLPRTDLKLVYKFNDVRTTCSGDLEQMPLVAKHRGLITLDYYTKNERWRFNTSLQLVGQQRLPVMSHTDHSAAGHASLELYQVLGETPSYATLNAQVTHTFKDTRWEVYVGGENLTNYMQHHPIIGASDPFNEDASIPLFDASQIYAPIMGAIIYGGFRFSIK